MNKFTVCSAKPVEVGFTKYLKQVLAVRKKLKQVLNIFT